MATAEAAARVAPREARDGEIARLVVDAGLPVPAAARQLGCCAETVRLALHRLGYVASRRPAAGGTGEARPTLGWHRPPPSGSALPMGLRPRSASGPAPAAPPAPPPALAVGAAVAAPPAAGAPAPAVALGPAPTRTPSPTASGRGPRAARAVAPPAAALVAAPVIAPAAPPPPAPGTAGGRPPDPAGASAPAQAAARGPAQVAISSTGESGESGVAPHGGLCCARTRLDVAARFGELSGWWLTEGLRSALEGVVAAQAQALLALRRELDQRGVDVAALEVRLAQAQAQAERPPRAAHPSGAASRRLAAARREAAEAQQALA